MSYGKIYETSWWGTAHLNTIGFGSIYEDLPPKAAFNLNPFKSRVSSDGGTFEAEACLKAEIERIEAI